MSNSGGNGGSSGIVGIGVSTGGGGGGSSGSSSVNIRENNQNNSINNSEGDIATPVARSTSPQSSVSSRSSPLPTNSCSPVPSNANGLIPKLPDGMSSLKSIAQQVIVRAGLEIPQSDANARNMFEGSGKQNSATSEAHIPPLLGVAPLGPVPLQKEHQIQFQMMEAAYFHMPHPSDSERLRSYLPRNLCPTPPYYQQVGIHTCGNVGLN